MHTWIGSIAEAVSGHADDLEEASSDFARMHAELIAYERKIVDVLQGTETKIGEAFAKIDSLIGQLHQDTTMATAEMAGLATLQNTSPAGLTQNTSGRSDTRRCSLELSGPGTHPVGQGS